MKKKYHLLLLVVILVFSLSIACTPQKKPTPVPKTNVSKEETPKATDNTRKAKAIADIIVKEKNDVKSATVVLTDNKAYVGINLKANVTGVNAENIKKDIATIVRNEDKSIDNVYVTEDADIVQRLKNIAGDIEKGKPVSGFLDEIEIMFKRITPSAK